MKLQFAAIFALSSLSVAPALAQFADLNAIIASIGSSKFTRIAGELDGAGSARVEKLSTLPGAATAGQGLIRAETIYERDLDVLHSNLMTSALAMQAIRASGFDVNNIVAFSLDSEGSVILYADDLK